MVTILASQMAFQGDDRVQKGVIRRLMEYGQASEKGDNWLAGSLTAGYGLAGDKLSCQQADRGDRVTDSATVTVHIGGNRGQVAVFTGLKRVCQKSGKAFQKPLEIKKETIVVL